MLGQEQGRRVRYLAQPLVGHGEHTQFVHGAEAVLERPHQAEAGVGIALEVEHRIDHMLEHTRPGQGAVLGHVADENDGHAGLLGHAGELRRALTDLGDGPRRRGECFRVDGLNGIDHRHLRFQAAYNGLDFFQLDFRQQLN